MKLQLINNIILISIVFSLSPLLLAQDTDFNQNVTTQNEIKENITVETILNNYIFAIGGREKIESVKDKIITLKGNINGTEITLQIFQRAPNKFKQKLVSGMVEQTILFDGKNGWKTGMGKELKLTGDQLIETKLESTLNLFLDYKSNEIKIEFDGIELVDQKETYKLILTLPTGKKWFHYYERKSGYLVKKVSVVDTPQGKHTQTILFSDYREEYGIMYPFKLTQSLGEQSIILEVNSIEINNGLSDSLFELN